MNEKGKKNVLENTSKKGDLAIVLFNFIRTTSDELTLYKNEYLIGMSEMDMLLVIKEMILKRKEYSPLL